jgi:lipopolysaccharide/colanic/teichoic acid biosynthesis glycosyltransferase
MNLNKSSSDPSRAKRAFDLAVAIPAALITSPVMLAAAAAMAITNRSSPIFTQERVGQHGEPFNIYKIKTLKDATNHTATSPIQTNRETRLGNYLRRTRLDELPQLFNIIAGDMALIGPRPIPASEKIALHPERIKLKPGLIGYAQLELMQTQHNTNISAPDRRLQLDLINAANRSWALDLKLMAMTGHEVLRKIAGKKPRPSILPNLTNIRPE